MSIPSISAPAPVSPSAPGPSATPDPQISGNDADDASAASPPAQAALPPGQGTRIDQLV